MPTNYGEAGVIRLLDQSKLILTFNELGLDDDQKTYFYEMIKNNKDSGYKILGIIAEKAPDKKIYLGKINELEKILDEKEVDDVNETLFSIYANAVPIFFVTRCASAERRWASCG